MKRRIPPTTDVMTNELIIIRAIDVIDQNDPIPESGHKLAKLVIEKALRSKVSVLISFKGLRGVPSSFFHPLLQDLLEKLGAQWLMNDVNFEFESDAQKSVFDRSRKAISNPPPR
jgi:hypothetical protein